MVRILIHRQSLALTLSFLSGKGSENRGNEGLKNTMFHYSRDICVQTAMETIRLVGLRHEQTAEAVGPSWFNLYYLFNAILVVVSHVVDPHHRDDKLALRRLDEAMSMINRMSISQACAQRAYLFLQQLLSYMDKSISEHQHQPARTTPALHPTQQAQPPQQQQQGPGPGPQEEYDMQTAPHQHQHQQQQQQQHLQHHQPYPLPSTLDEAAAAAAGGYDLDFLALLDVTQDLAENLGSQLESHGGMEPAMWAWMDQSSGVGVGVGDAEMANVEGGYSAR